MENWKYSILLVHGVFFAIGVICLLVGGAIKIKESENIPKNKVAYYISGIGELAILISIVGALKYIFQEFAVDSFLLSYFIFPLVSIILTMLLSRIIWMWVRWKKSKN